MRFLIIILIVHFSLSIMCDISHSMIELIILVHQCVRVSVCPCVRVSVCPCISVSVH